MNRVIIAITCFLTTSVWGQIDGASLFDDNVLHEIRFELMDTTFYAATEDYQRVRLIIDGTLVDSIGVKRKGNISAYYNPDKLGVKIKTNKYVAGKDYDGIKEFSLHMNYQDPTMMREKLTYDLCRELGLFSLRAAYAKVYMNDVYRGLYTMVEAKDELFKQQFDHRNMDAVESLDFGSMCYISNTATDYDYDNNGGNPTYILANGSATTAWERFATMIDKANNTPNAQYMDIVPNYLNLEHFFKYQALNVYLMNFDSYIQFLGNQIYMFDTVQQKWQILPWDFNASFGLWDTNNEHPETYPFLPASISSGCIAEKLNDLPDLKNYYMQAMCELESILGDTTTYFARIDQLQTLIQQAVYEDSRKHCSNDDFNQGINYGYHSLFGENQPALKTFIQTRNEVIRTGLENHQFDCGNLGNSSLEPTTLFSVYPNPVNNDLYFLGVDLTQNNYSICISDMRGIIQIRQASVQEKTDVSELLPGVYFVHLINGSSQHTLRFVKQ